MTMVDSEISISENGDVSPSQMLTDDEFCGGTCRARSYFESGSIFVNSDFCEYEKLAYINGILEHTKLEEL